MINIYDVKYEQLAIEHYNQVVKQIVKTKIYKLIDYDLWFKQFDNKYSLEYVITANPKELEEIRDKCESQNYPPYIKYLVSMYNKKFSLKSEYVGDGYNALEMTKKLELRVCPLCNRNHIGNVYRNNHGWKRTCQLDHFHNKSQYPYLAMSFFNLIPACPSCNHTKSIYDIDASPYDQTINFNDLIHFTFDIKSINATHDENDISVSLNYHPSISKNIDILGLRHLYETHNDTVFEIIQTYSLYTDLLSEDIFNSFSSLFHSKEDIRNKLFGSYMNQDNLKKQVLAKLKNDIFKELEMLLLIK